ncbi:hypothetical protein C4577_05960 [Candidatus Parcubacteria bacterium]|nr:MAG: hypothetical protein C4577_05960 [Candidatus Parcubacteria bacterium]
MITDNLQDFILDHKYLLLIILISFIPFIGFLFNPLLFHTHDGLVHIPRIAAYFKALTDGQFPVRWASGLNYGYGMPLFNFMYVTPYFISSMLVFIGLGLVSSFKITIFISYLLSGIFMFKFSKTFFEDEKKAFLVAVFYQFFSFRFVDAITRASFGEVYAYTFLPLVLYGLTLFFKSGRYIHFLLASIATGLLIISHNSISLAFFGVCFLFVLFFAGNKKNMVFGLSALFTGLLLSSFYWVPAILEHRYTYGDLFMKDIYLSHFPPLQNLFIPNLFNNQILYTEGISVQLGVFPTAAILLSVFLFFRKKKKQLGFNSRLFLFSLTLIIISIFFMQPVSGFFWQNISLLRQFQFPWRLLSVCGFAVSLLAVNFLLIPFFKKKKVFILLIVLVVISNYFYWQPNLGVDKIDEKYYWNFPLNTTYYGETDIIWSEGPKKLYPKQRVEVISGKGEVFDYDQKSNIKNYKVEAVTNIVLVDHTQFFPGWKVYVDKKEVPIQFQDPNWRGEITFSVPRGNHIVQVKFQETKMRLISDGLSLVTLILLIALFPTFRKHRI